MKIAFLVLLVAVSPGCRRKRAQVTETPPSAAGDAEPAARSTDTQPQQVPQFDVDIERSELRVVATVNGGPIADGMICDTFVYSEGSRRDPLATGPCGTTLRFPAGTRDAYASLRAGALSTELKIPTETYGKQGKTVVLDFVWAVGRARAAYAADPAITACQVKYRRGDTVALEARAGELVSLEAGDYTPVFDCALAGGGTLQVSGGPLTVVAGRDTQGEFKLNLGAPASASPNAGAVDSGAKNTSIPSSGTPLPPLPVGENRPREPDGNGAPARELAPQKYRENP
jgi:hypothetical protein